MTEKHLRELLEAVRSGELSSQQALERLKHLPFEDLGFAKVDHHRALRQGYAEVVFGKGKTPAQVAEIVRAMLRQKVSRILRSDHDRANSGNNWERNNPRRFRGDE
jgi:NCAIR mutase (PurE)-related protein